MSVELLYTSAPKGLRQGSRGFCTVLSTVGTPVNLAARLESLSGYRHLFATESAEADSNPVAYSHVRFQLAGQPTSVVSRVAAYGADYSGRTNKLAHHVVVDVSEAPPAGPAWLMQQPGFMRTTWNGRCGTPATGPLIPQADQGAGICRSWLTHTGDAGWGGVVADAFAKPHRTEKPTWIIYAIDQRDRLLTLLNESIALLPRSQRWNATFSTYAASLPPDIDCRVRCVVDGTEEARFAAARGQVIQLVPRPYTGKATERVNQARGVSAAGTSHTPSVTAVPAARAVDHEEVPPHTPPLPKPATIAAAGMPELPSRHSGRWIVLALLSAALIAVMSSALTFFVLQSESDTPANLESSKRSPATINSADAKPTVVGVDSELTGPDGSVEIQVAGHADASSDVAAPESDAVTPQSQTLNLSQTPSVIPPAQMDDDQQQLSADQPVVGPQVDAGRAQDTASTPDTPEPQLTIDPTQAQLELSFESVLQGRPEVLITASDARIQAIGVKDALWASGDGSAEGKRVPMRVVARQSLRWLDTCPDPPAADVRIHQVDDDKHGEWEIEAAISASDHRLFLRVRPVAGSTRHRLAEFSRNIRTLVEDLNREVGKISVRETRKELILLRRTWKTRPGDNDLWSRINAVGGQLQQCLSSISEFQQTITNSSSTAQQQLDAYRQRLRPIERTYNALAESIEKGFDETFDVDTGRELHLFADQVAADVAAGPVLVMPVKFSVHVSEPGR